MSCVWLMGAVVRGCFLCSMWVCLCCVSLFVYGCMVGLVVFGFLFGFFLDVLFGVLVAAVVVVLVVVWWWWCVLVVAVWLMYAYV